MKRILVVFCIAALTVGLTACGINISKPESLKNQGGAEVSSNLDETQKPESETTSASTEATTQELELLNVDECLSELNPLLKGLNDIDYISACAIEYDYNSSIVNDANGIDYYKVTDSRFNSLADIEKFFSTYLSQNLMNDQYAIIARPEGGCYMEKDGVLYVASCGRGCGFAWTDTKAEISDITNTSFTARKEYDEFGTMAYIKLVIVYSDGAWKIDSYAYD